MKLAVIGSRGFSDYPLLIKEVTKLNPSLIVSGGAIGADSLAEKAALELGIPTKIFLPEWNKFGRRAGFIRNQLIIDEAQEVIAFWDGVSKGTKNSIDITKSQNKRVHVVLYRQINLLDF